ncbi:MAG: hypothetical protein Q9188_007107 [Gyalolechia gomerana]
MDEEADSVIGTSTMQDREGGYSLLSPYRMHIVIEPPREARLGDRLIPPPTVCLRTPEDHREDESLVEDLSRFWASVSMVSEDGMVALAPPSTTLISGTLVDSVREAYHVEDEGEIGYFLFQNLSINQPGNFRFRISLMQMPTSGTQAPDGNGDTTPLLGIMNTGSILTRVISIHDNAPRPNVG